MSLLITAWLTKKERKAAPTAVQTALLKRGLIRLVLNFNRHSYHLPFKDRTSAVSKAEWDAHLLLLIHITQQINYIPCPSVMQLLLLVPSDWLLHLQVCVVPSTVTLTDRDEAVLFCIMGGWQLWTLLHTLLWTFLSGRAEDSWGHSTG